MFIGTSVSYATHIRNTLYNYHIKYYNYINCYEWYYDIFVNDRNYYFFFETECPVPQVGFELTMQPRMVSDSEYPSSTSQALGLQPCPSTPSSCSVGKRTQCSMSARQTLYTLTQVSTPILIDIFINIFTYCKYMLYIPYFIYINIYAAIELLVDK